jgi:pimeloyl-ACP methyl ester carboxylesterase
MVHGHPFDRGMWAPQLRTLGGRHRLIAPDLRGYGESTVVPGTTPLDAFARDLAALLDHLGIAGAAPCGLTMGGCAARPGRTPRPHPDAAGRSACRRHRHAPAFMTDC